MEIKAGTLTRVAPDGSTKVVANLGGGPNGAAIGPDGAVYVCNDGGFLWMPVPQMLADRTQGTIWVGYGEPQGFTGGSIQRVDGDKVTTLYTEFQAMNPLTRAPDTAKLRLRSPDDLVFDHTGSFWFTDWGKKRARDEDLTGVCYAKPDGSSAQEMIYPLRSPNGIGLSPDEKRLYVAETYTRRILYWQLDGPGKIRWNPNTVDGCYLLTAAIPGEGTLDSLALDEEGNVYVATMMPQGLDPYVNGGITIISPYGEVLEYMEIDAGQPDPLPSNLCFGGPDRRTLYITLGGSGRLVAATVRIAGKKLAFH